MDDSYPGLLQSGSQIKQWRRLLYVVDFYKNTSGEKKIFACKVKTFATSQSL
jgi:hypothetical protein